MELRNKYNIRELTKAEVLKQLGKENMVEFVSVVDFHNSNKIFEAALKSQKSFCDKDFKNPSFLFFFCYPLYALTTSSFSMS